MLIKIKVKTEAKKDKVIQKSPDHFEISVTDQAERGLANKKVLVLVRKYFKEYNKITIIKGHRSPHKIININ